MIIILSGSEVCFWVSDLRGDFFDEVDVGFVPGKLFDLAEGGVIFDASKPHCGKMLDLHKRISISALQLANRQQLDSEVSPQLLHLKFPMPPTPVTSTQQVTPRRFFRPLEPNRSPLTWRNTRCRNMTCLPIIEVADASDDDVVIVVDDRCSSGVEVGDECLRCLPPGGS